MVTCYNLYNLTFMLVQMEMVGNVHVTEFEVSHELVNLNLFNLNIGQSKFFRLVRRKMLLPQREQPQHTLPDHPESRVAERSLEVSQHSRQYKRVTVTETIF